MMSHSLILFLSLCVISHGQSWLPVQIIPSETAAMTFYSPRDELRGVVVTSGRASLISSTTLGATWTWTELPGENISEVKVDQEYTGLFNGTHLLIFRDIIMIATFPSEGDFVLSSNGNQSLLLIYRDQNMSWSRIYHQNWSSPVSLNRTGLKPALSAAGGLDWAMSLVDESGEYFGVMLNGIWFSITQVSSAPIVPEYIPDLAHSPVIGTIFKISPTSLRRMLGIAMAISVPGLPNATVEHTDGYFFVLSDRLYYASILNLNWISLELPGENCSGVALSGIGLGVFCGNEFHLLTFSWGPILRPQLNITVATILATSLGISQTLRVEAPLQIQGDLHLENTSVIYLRTSLYIGGEAHLAGRLHILDPIPGPILIYNSSNSTFDQIEIPECYRTEYSRTQLMVIYTCQLAEEDWIKWVVIGVVIVTVIIAVILMVIFRKKIFPFADRRKWSPQS